MNVDCSNPWKYDRPRKSFMQTSNANANETMVLPELSVADADALLAQHGYSEVPADSVLV